MSELAVAAGLTSGVAPLRDEAASLGAAVRDFEGYFVGELLRMAGRAGPSSGLLDGGRGGQMYRELFLEEIGRLVARRSGLGLAGSLGVASDGSDASDGSEAPAGAAGVGDASGPRGTR